MNKLGLRLTGAVALTFALAPLTMGQGQPAPNQTQQNQPAQTQSGTQPTQTTGTTQTTPAVQNPDGSWSVIEYPADKEVTLSFTPGADFSSAQGRARVTRSGGKTTINLDLSGLHAGAAAINLYAVDPAGRATLLGPVNVSGGAATQTFTTPLSKFMLLLSPDAGLTSVGPGTAVAFRSAVPQGFAVVPMTSSGERDGAVVGERVGAGTTPGSTSAYEAPLLGIPNWRKGTDTHMRIDFTGELTGSRANVFIEPRKDGATTIKMRFHELKDAPAGKRYVVWAVGPDKSFHRLGQVVNTGQRNEAQIQTETDLKDFGLFITTEEAAEAARPVGAVIGTVVIDKK